MPVVKLNIKPGFDGQSTQTANESGWFSGNLVRWRLGLLEKLAGWARLFDQQLLGHVRSMNAWLDLSNNKLLLMAGDGHVAELVNTTVTNLDFAGVISTDTGSVAFSVASGTTPVTVTGPFGDPLPITTGIKVGDVLIFNMQMSIGGIHYAAGQGVTVTSFTPGVSIGFNLSSNALVTDTNAKPWPIFTFDWTSSEAVVHFERHGLVIGNTFLIDQTTKLIGGFPGIVAFQIIIPGGTFLTVTSVVDVDNFRFDWTLYLVSGSGGVATLPATLGEGETFYYKEISPTIFGLVFHTQGTTNFSGATDWFTANLGEIGLLTFTASPLYQLPSGATSFRAVGASDLSAPQLNNAMLVAMPQAQVILLGSETTFGSGQQDPLLIRWSDAGTFDVWSATVSNQAGSFRLGRGSKIIGGLQAPQTTLIWTDTDVWSMSYIGPPLVYGFTIMASGCGLVAPHAAVTIGGTTIWASRESFWQFSGGGVTPLPCPQWDYIFRDINPDELHRVHMGASTSTHEAYCFFPSLADKLPTGSNLLLFSQQFSNLTWARLGLFSITEGLTAPDGSTTAEKFIESSSSGFHGLEQIVKKDASVTTYTFSIYASTASTRNFEISVFSAGGGVFAQFNSTTGAVIASAASGDFVLTSALSTTDSLATGPIGNGWLRYVLTFISDSDLSLFVDVNSIDGSNNDIYTGNGTSGVVIWGAQLNLGTVMDYQVTTSTTDPNECTRYVKYNIAEGLWDPGKWPRDQARTAWIDENIFGPPLGADNDSRIQQHETGFDDDGQPMLDVSATTGYADLGDGQDMMSVSKCIPDLKWFGVNGGVDLVLNATSYPNGKVISHGPFSITSDTQWFTTRLRARQVSMQFNWRAELGFSARLGATRFDVKPTGTHP